MKRPLAAFATVFALAVLFTLPAFTQSKPDKKETPVEPLPAAFDLRDLECVTSIKQQAGGTCWAHGTMAAIESNLIISGFWKAMDRENSVALSEYHLDWWNGFNKHDNTDIADPTKDPTGLRVHQGGDYRVAAAYLSRGDGVVVLPKNHDRFRDTTWYTKPPPRTDAAYQRFYVRDVEWFTMGDDLEGIDVIKRRIMNDGAIGTCYASGRTYIGKDFVHYQPSDARGNPNHAVAIIGWDDKKITTDPAMKAPPKPGAWLIKNSWGTRRVEQGYNWISYYDKHCCRDKEMGAVSFRNIEPMVYTDIYFHDYHGWRDTLKEVSKAFNVYTATGRQHVRAVSFYTAKHDVKYTVKIYSRFDKGELQGELASKSGSIAYCGFHTINLDTPLLLQKEDKFFVSVELSEGGHAIDRTSQIPVLLGQEKPPRFGAPPWVISKANAGESFYHDGTSWQDLFEHKFADEKFNKTANFCIKALAVSVEESPFGKAPLLVNSLPARNIGPANMGGRITDVDVVESNPKIMYVGSATGGVWKTTDAGDTWTPIFDQQTTLGIGDIAVCQAKPEVIWVGTGESNPRNSVTWGDGVYKSIDAGKTWTNVGLKETRHIGRIVAHPKNPDIAYVAALGHLWAPNRDRGLYRTADGGKTWQKVKYFDENTGFVDVAMDPNDPDILYAAAYCVRRDAFSGGNPVTQTGPHAGLYKTENGGKTWNKMTEGLPEGQYGRCGLSVYRKDPNIVYAVVQTDKTPTSTAGAGAKPGNDVATGGIFRSEDKGRTWTKLNDLCPRPFYYGQIRVDPSDDERIYVLGVQFHVSNDGGKSFSGGRGGAGGGVHPDHHTLWINPEDSNQVILGNDGGLYFSKDKAKTWEAVRGLAIGQFYAIAVDMRQPYRVYGGLQDNGSWGGVSATTSTEGITLADWRRVGGGDGFYCQVDPTDPDTVYCESQYGALRRLNLRGGAGGGGGMGGGRAIKPRPAQNEPAYRFNWNSPMLLSPHDSKTLYYGGNHLFKSSDRGDKWEVISPDLTRGQPGPDRSTGHTLTTIAESPVKAGVLWVGTDDGKLHVTRDGGTTWTDLSEKIPQLPQERWITRVECSHFGEGTAYVCIGRYRNDDLRPYIFKTNDFGAAWTRLANNLPEEGSVHVVRESSKNKDLLFAGTENGLFASLDGGKRWHAMKNGLPASVPVHDLVIHPRDRDLVIGTHGRSIYVMDIAPLEELTTKVLTSNAHLFEVKSATALKFSDPAKPSGKRDYKAPNPPEGAVIHYALRKATVQPVTLTVVDASGKEVARLNGAKEVGLHRVVWDLRGKGENGGAVEPGEYTVTLEAGNSKQTKKLRVDAVTASQ